MKYEIGDKVFVLSRYDGVVKRTIVSILDENKYELDYVVQVGKSTYIGNKAIEKHEGEYFFPAKEHHLTLIGEPIYNTSIGIHEQILTPEMINYEN